MAEDLPGRPNSFQFGEQFRRMPAKLRAEGESDLTETLIRKQGLAAIGSVTDPTPAAATKFADQMRTTLKRRPTETPHDGVPSCLRLLPPDLLARWRVQKPEQLAKVQALLEASELQKAYVALRELLYDAPRLSPLIDDIFLVEAYSQLPAEAKLALPATSLKAVMPSEALPAFADIVGKLKQGDGDGCASALAQLADFSPAAERLVAQKLKKILPPPTPPTQQAAPEIRPTRATVQAAFTPPPTPEPEFVAEVAYDGAMAWLYALGLQGPWKAFVQRCEAHQWDSAWDAAEEVAAGLAAVDPEHEELPVLGEAMAIRVSEGMLAEMVPELASLLEPTDLFPVMAGGGTALMLGCNDALSMGDWPDACERLAMMPEDTQIEALASAIIAVAWRTMDPAVIQQASAADVLSCWIEGGANALLRFLRSVRLGERRGAEEGLKALAGLGASNTKIALIRAKLGWHLGSGTPSGLRPTRPTR